MNERTKNYLIFGFLMAFAAGIYGWYYPLDRGTVMVSVGLSDYWVLNAERDILCATDPCEVTLRTGIKELKVQKDGYFPQTSKIQLRRFRPQSMAVELKKVPTLKPTDWAPNEKRDLPLPTALDPKSVLASAWDDKGEQLAFLDSADETVKVWSEGSAKRITPLKGIGEGFSFLWAPDGTRLAGMNGKDLYFIDTKAASRKKVELGFVPRNQRWSLESDALWMNGEAEKVLHVDPGTGMRSTLGIEVDLSHAAWGPNATLIYYLVSGEENLAKVMNHDLRSGETTEIISKFGFPVSGIVKDGDGKVYLENPSLESWFMLEY